MNGLAFTTKVIIQVVVAKINNIYFTLPSGVIAQSNVANTAMTNSATIPADAIAICLRQSASFQVSPVSVYIMGAKTINATPIVGTLTP